MLRRPVPAPTAVIVGRNIETAGNDPVIQDLHGRPTLVEETTERSELGDVNEPRAVAVGAILGAEGDGLVVYVDGRRYQGVAKDDEDHEGERDEGDDGEGSLEVRYVELAEQDGPDLKVGVVLLAITVVVAIQAGQHDV